MINWIPNFHAGEWPDGAIEQMSPRLLNDAIFPLRLASGVSMTPSPLLGAHVRSSGTSRHSTQGGERLSDATDLFIGDNVNDVTKVWIEAQRVNAIGGFGIYFDKQMHGKPNVMIHIDTRPMRMLWLTTEAGEYIYWHRDPSRYLAELSKHIGAMSL